MNVKIQVDEISSIIKERIDNFVSYSKQMKYKRPPTGRTNIQHSKILKLNSKRQR